VKPGAAGYPRALAYNGQAGRPTGTVVFDIELLDTRRPPSGPAPDVAARPDDAASTPSLARCLVARVTGFQRHAVPRGERDCILLLDGLRDRLEREATIILSNHSEFDEGYMKARTVSTMGHGEDNPFVIKDGVVPRYKPAAKPAPPGSRIASIRPHLTTMAGQLRPKFRCIDIDRVAFERGILKNAWRLGTFEG